MRPLLFGLDDLRQRTQIYDIAEAMNPFYQIMAQQGLKQRILDWTQTTSCSNRQNRITFYDWLQVLINKKPTLHPENEVGEKALAKNTNKRIC